MSLAKLWRRWVGQQDANHRLTYETQPAPGVEGTNLEPVPGAPGVAAGPPSRPGDEQGHDLGAGPSGSELPEHYYTEHLQANEQQNEQEQLMLALAISESLATAPAEAAAKEVAVNHAASTSLTSADDGRAEALSQKYWEEGMLSAEDQVCDGFFDVNGEFPELGAGDVFPSYDFLSRFEPAMDDLREVRRKGGAILLGPIESTTFEWLARPFTSTDNV